MHYPSEGWKDASKMVKGLSSVPKPELKPNTLLIGNSALEFGVLSCPTRYDRRPYITRPDGHIKVRATPN